MHEATRTFCCRAGFLLGCVLPTLLMAAWIGFRQSPVYGHAQRTGWQSELSRSLGLAVRVERVEEPKPGEYVLQGITLIDPDAPASSPPLATVTRLHLARRNTGLVVLGSDATISSEHLPRLWAILHERLVRGPEIASTPVLLSLTTVALSGDKQRAGALTLHDVRMQLASTSTVAKGAIEFRLAGQTGEPVRMAVERNRAQQPVATRWSINTGGAPLPCSAFAPCLAELTCLGSACTFHGYITCETRDTTWQAIASGNFAQLDLEKLVSQQFHHTLTGTADVALTQAHWRDGKLLAAAGQMRAKQGLLGRSLWEAAASSLSLRLADRLRQYTNDEVRYGELAVGFQLNEQVLQLTGHCNSPAENSVVADQYGPLILGGSTVEPIALVRALVPDSELQVPAVREARQLIYLLPLPAASQDARRN